MVEKIQGKRESKVHVDFEKIASPFGLVFTPSDQNTTAAPAIKHIVESVANFDLSAIMNDQARINGQWVTIGDKIEGYDVQTIEENRVVLKKGNRSVELFLPNPKNTKLFQIK